MRRTNGNRHHAVNGNGALVHSGDNFDSVVTWAFDYLEQPFSVLTTRNGKPAIQRESRDMERPAPRTAPRKGGASCH